MTSGHGNPSLGDIKVRHQDNCIDSFNVAVSNRILVDCSNLIQYIQTSTTLANYSKDLLTRLAESFKVNELFGSIRLKIHVLFSNR